MTDPLESVAREIAARFFGAPPVELRRFPVGLAHSVYDATARDGSRAVVRLGGTAEEVEGAVRWTRVLRPLGVPVPGILDVGRLRGEPYLVLERIDGEDLGPVYATLRPDERRALAEAIWNVQERVATLPQGPRFGFVRGLAQPTHASWRGVVEALLERNHARLLRPVDQGTGEMEALALAGGVAAALDRFDEYFASIRPVAFLDDTTTKNVLVRRGTLAGIVDVDGVCYGDPLLVLGLTRAALLADGLATDYVDRWAELAAPSERHRAALLLYTALYCVDLLGERPRPGRDLDDRFAARRRQRLIHALAEHLGAAERS